MRRIVVVATVALLAVIGVPSAAALFHPTISVSHDPLRPGADRAMSVRLDFTGDRAPARAVVYVPLGYELDLTAPAGRVIGSATASIGNTEYRANVVVDTLGGWNGHPCQPFVQTGFAYATWLVTYHLAGQDVRIPIFVEAPNLGSQKAGVYRYRIEICFPAPVGPSTQGVAAGVSVRSLWLDLRGIGRAPGSGAYLWFLHSLPYAAAAGTPALAEGLESRARIGFPAGMTFAASRASGGRRLLQGRLSEAGRPVVGVPVEVFDGRRRLGAATTGASGTFAVNIRLARGRHALRAVANVFPRVVNPTCADASPFALNWPFVPFWERGRPCVSELQAFYTAQARLTLTVP